MKQALGGLTHRSPAVVQKFLVKRPSNTPLAGPLPSGLRGGEAKVSVDAQLRGPVGLRCWARTGLLPSWGPGLPEPWLRPSPWPWDFFVVSSWGHRAVWGASLSTVGKALDPKVGTLCLAAR